MSIKQFVSFAADFIAVVLMIWQMVRLSKQPGEDTYVKKYFTRLSGVVLIMAVLSLLNVYSDVQLGTFTMQDFGKLSEAEQTTWYVAEIVSWIVGIFVTTVFFYMWITFLSLYLFDDRDFVKRRFWVGFTPLIVSAVISAESVLTALLSAQGYRFFIMSLGLFFVIRILYFMLCLWLLHEYKRQNGYLRFFNPWLFFIPVFAGWILQDIFMWDFASLGSALGIVLLYLSINEEIKYVDYETGFYNMGFVNYLKELAKKNDYDSKSAIVFTLDSSDKMKGFASELKRQLPQNCEPILQGDKKVVVLTSVGDRGILSMVTEDVKMVCEVEVNCVLKKKNETTTEFMERVL